MKASSYGPRTIIPRGQKSLCTCAVHLQGKKQVAQSGGRCPIPGNIPGQVGRGSEQPDLVEDVPAHGRGVGLDAL